MTTILPVVTPDSSSKSCLNRGGIVSAVPILEERVLLRELNHRISNEFCSAISLVSLAAARSRNNEVKVALTGVGEPGARPSDASGRIIALHRRRHVRSSGTRRIGRRIRTRRLASRERHG